MEGYSIHMLLTALALLSSVSSQTPAPTECTSPPVVTNAQVTMTGISEGSTATYTCNDGYEPSGSMQKACRGGAWTASGPEPTCTAKKCPRPSRIDNGYSSSNILGRDYIIGSVVSYTCYTGYYLSDNTTATITCQNNKTWTQPLPVCNKKDCGPPSFIEGGNVTFTDTRYFAQSSYSCNEGYSLYNNGVLTRAATVSIRCQSSGAWARAPECRPKDCGTPANIRYAQRFSEGKHTFGQTVFYECNHGYQIRGNSSISCQSNGRWTVLPECILVTCGNAPTIQNGNADSVARMSYGNSVRYNCNKGYDLFGPSSVSCQADGSYTQLPSCSVVNCRTPPAIHFGKHSWQGTTYGEQATYECDKGYKLIGVSTIVCQADGKWSDSPTCEIPPGLEKAAVAPTAAISSVDNRAASSNTSALTGLSIACALFAVITLLLLFIVVYKMFLANRTDKLFSYASYKNGDDTVNSNV